MNINKEIRYSHKAQVYILKITVLFLLFISKPIFAASITNLVGDIDGFGEPIGLASPPNGFNLPNCCFDNRSASDPDFTDVWSFQLPEVPTLINYTHSYINTLIDPVASVTLSIQSAGMGNARGPWAVFFNGINVGEIGGPTSFIGATEVITDFFNIPVFLLDQNGQDIISLVYQDTGADGFAINYSQLTLSSEIPLPGSLLFMISSLTALLGYRKVKLHSK